MARPLRIEYPGAFYHVTSRGNERRDIFKSQRDREKFLEYLESATVRYGAVVHAYCLMTNHYHLLVETPDGNLSQVSTRPIRGPRPRGRTYDACDSALLRNRAARERRLHHVLQREAAALGAPAAGSVQGDLGGKGGVRGGVVSLHPPQPRAGKDNEGGR